MRRTTIQELILTAFDQDVLENVSDLFESRDTEFYFNNFQISFRLFKSSDNHINIEALTHMSIRTGENIDFNEIGTAQIANVVKFWKPIGFYTRHLFQTDYEITILKEFEKDLSTLYQAGKIRPYMEIKALTLVENAVIAGFSIEANLQAIKYEDCSFVANGLNCDLFMCDQGFPQFFLDDKYGLEEGPFTAYLIKQENRIAPGIGYEEYFQKFHSMSLLTSLKVVR